MVTRLQRSAGLYVGRPAASDFLRTPGNIDGSCFYRPDREPFNRTHEKRPVLQVNSILVNKYDSHDTPEGCAFIV